MAKTSELYASPWLRCEDLQNRAVKVNIAGATIDELPQQDGGKQKKVIVSFVGKSRKLILNKTQHTALCSITGSDDTDDWVGVIVILSPGLSAQGKGTIVITGMPVEENGSSENPF